MGVPDGNLSLPLLMWGICLALTAMLLSIPTRAFLFKYFPVSGDLEFFLVNGAYAMVMFVSRLVEEEHRFWYYVSPLWLAYVGFRRCVATQRSPRPSRKKNTNRFPTVHSRLVTC